MKIKFVLVAFLFLTLNFTLAMAIPNGYQITFKSKESKSKRVYLGNFYGKFNQYVDSVVLDTNGNAVFKANT